jgi:enoyl-CoA hydratase/carnithine racemase
MCDLRVATASATFRFPGATYGLAVGTGLLASLIGPSRAKDLIFTTRVVAAHEALTLGLVNQVIEGDVKAAARQIAAGIARNSRGALAASKRLIDRTVRPAQLMLDEAEENRGLRTAEQAQRFQAAADAVTRRAR